MKGIYIFMTVTNVNRAYLSVFKETHYPSKEELHRTYGGEIYGYDFDGHIYLSDAASNIARSWSFDRTCKQNIKARANK